MGQSFQYCQFKYLAVALRKALHYIQHLIVRNEIRTKRIFSRLFLFRNICQWDGGVGIGMVEVLQCQVSHNLFHPVFQFLRVAQRMNGSEYDDKTVVKKILGYRWVGNIA